jgi:hypothetical protein
VALFVQAKSSPPEAKPTLEAKKTNLKEKKVTGAPARAEEILFPAIDAVPHGAQLPKSLQLSYAPSL